MVRDDRMDCRPGDTPYLTWCTWIAILNASVRLGNVQYARTSSSHRRFSGIRK